ncbi:unnamed protein product, partial [Larinioides sclopetarius]
CLQKLKRDIFVLIKWFRRVGWFSSELNQAEDALIRMVQGEVSSAQIWSLHC